MRMVQRLAVVPALAALGLSLAACGDDEPVGAGTMPATASPTNTAMATSMGDGVTQTDDTFGAGCANLPADASNEGSLAGMVDDPVATAASNNPLLAQLTGAVQAAGLVDTLNDTNARYTVFAPYDPAFEALGADTLESVMADKPELTNILTYHVVPQRLDKDGILSTGSLTTVQGESLAISGSGDNITVNGANVLCGNIPTANATVFVIDKVLMPAG